MLQEGVLESVRMRCSHDRSPWTSSHLLANGPALCPETNARAPFCACALPGEWSPGWDQVTWVSQGQRRFHFRTGLLGQSFAPAVCFPICGAIHPTRTDLARMTALPG